MIMTETQVNNNIGADSNIVRHLIDNQHEIYKKIVSVTGLKYVSYNDVYKFFRRQELESQWCLDTLVGELLTYQQVKTITHNFYYND